MTQEQFKNIVDYIGKIIKGSQFDNHTYVVGGSVRDLILGSEIKDIDICVSLPNGGIDLTNWFYDQNLLTHKPVTYPTYGTSMCVFKEFPDVEIECVQTRKEQYKDKNSRNPEVCFGSIEEDILRRDLTINSLLYNVSTRSIIDITGKGISDINNKVIRLTNTNDRDSILVDDPLRVLRICRFSCRFGWDIEPETYQAMIRNVDRLSIITKERIRDEFEKILLSKNATMGIKMLHDIGAMKYVVPEFDECFGLGQNSYHFGDVAEHTLALIDHYHNLFEPDVICLLSCFLHDIGKINTRTVGQDGRVHFYDHENETELVETILRRLKYDNSTIKEVCFIVKNHMRTKNFGNDCVKIKPKSLNKLIYTCKTRERFTKLCRVIECDNLSHHPDHIITGQFDYFMQQMDSQFFNYKLPVTGNDVMEVLNVPSGPVVKAILDRLVKHVFNRPNMTRDEMLKQIPTIHKQLAHENKLKSWTRKQN